MTSRIKDNLSEPLYKDINIITEAELPWNMLINKTVFITGGTGFICKYLVFALLNRNDIYNTRMKIVLLIRNKEKAQQLYGGILYRDDLKIIYQDVCSPINYDGEVHFVLHAASPASNYQFNNDPVGTIQANLKGTSNILEFSKDKQVESILFFSSLKVYGDALNSKQSVSEDDKGIIDFQSYKNCYAVGKMASETLCACYYKQYALPIKIVRPGYVYGASSMNDDRVWAQFIANIVREEDILLKSSGMIKRSFCYITDVVEGVMTVLLSGDNNTVYNISDEFSNITIRDFARQAVESSKEKKLKLVFENPNDATLSGENPKLEVLNSSRLNKLGWKAKVHIPEGIDRAKRILMVEKL